MLVLVVLVLRKPLILGDFVIKGLYENGDGSSFFHISDKFLREIWKNIDFIKTLGIFQMSVY